MASEKLCATSGARCLDPCSCAAHARVAERERIAAFCDHYAHLWFELARSAKLYGDTKERRTWTARSCAATTLARRIRAGETVELPNGQPKEKT